MTLNATPAIVICAAFAFFFLAPPQSSGQAISAGQLTIEVLRGGTNPSAVDAGTASSGGKRKKPGKRAAKAAKASNPNAELDNTHLPDDKVGTTLEIRVLNELGLEQSDADVVFEAPSNPAQTKPQASVIFSKDPADAHAAVSNKGTILTTKSSDTGRAKAVNILGNKVEGQVSIKIGASFEGKSASVTVIHVNKGHFWTKTHKEMLAGGLAIAGTVLYETLKPGPPTAAINGATATAAAARIRF